MIIRVKKSLVLSSLKSYCTWEMHAAMPIVTGQVETKFALAKKEKKKRKKANAKNFFARYVCRLISAAVRRS